MKTRCCLAVAALARSLAFAETGTGADTRALCDFEEPTLSSLWEVSCGAARLVAEGATSGRQALEVVFDPHGEYRGAYLSSYRLPKDWSACDALVLDVLNPGREAVAGYVLIADEPWREKGSSYWNRHNAERAFPPGKTRWVIPIHGLYRGEAGSRNNDIKADIDPARIVRVDFGFGRKGVEGRIVIDNLRLVKAASPTGVWAFDFGPPTQPVMLGWTPVSHSTGFTAERGYGWGPQGGAPWDGADRDTGFGSALLRDFCEAGGYCFRVAVPAGKYRVTVYFENSGYWGGEQARQQWRSITANGQAAWKEARPDGAAHALYRFESVEPVGVDLWKTYMAEELARPAIFDVEAKGNDGLNIRFDSDFRWGCKLAALAVVKAGDAQAEAWLDGQQRGLEAEFRSTAVALDPPAPLLTALPSAWQAAGVVAWPYRIEDEISPDTVPAAASLPAKPADLTVSRLAVRGETELFCVALRPLRDFGECRLTVEPLVGPGTIKGSPSAVWYNTQRDFGEVAYHVRGQTVRSQERIRLPAAVTRELAVRVKIPEQAAAGEYRGALVISDAQSKVLLRVPLRLTVAPVTLNRDTDFLMGFFGLMPPELLPEEKRWPVLEETLQMLREYGVNAVSGGPSWGLKGWQDGKPVIDYGEMDRFCALLAKYGFGRTLNGYGGTRFNGLHEGYVKGETAAAVEKQSGLPYDQALVQAWGAVHEHARAAGWPVILYAMCDETRVREVAERELEFMNLMAKVSGRYPATVRTSGSYSVSFGAEKSDADEMVAWHRKFFSALDLSSLNNHDESVMGEAARQGKDVHIYNQGTSRYSFGLYQWSEYTRGVKARWEWHLNILHGYQFFDLDGREPDTAMLCYGRIAIYPTLAFERCREGAEDFYLLQMLAKRDPASEVLRKAVAGVRLNQREPPAGFNAEELKRQLIETLLSKDAK